MEIIRKYWAPRISDSINSVRHLRNGQGVVFDLRIDMADGFVENYDLLKERDPRRVDFECMRLAKLPDLEGGNPSLGGGERRNYNGGGGGYGGSKGHGGGGYGGSRGGDRDGGQRRDNGGGYGGGSDSRR